MTAAVEQIQLIDLTQLEVHPSNPRKDVGNIDELAASIKSAGLIEPIVAVRHNGTFQVVAGSRRLAAARKAKMGALPVRVMDLDEAQAMAAALIENLQRKDLEPLEQAEAFRGWLTLTGKSQKELADTVGLAPSTIANALRLLEAPTVVHEALRTQTIGAEHARVLLALKDPEAAAPVLKQAGRFDQDDVRADERGGHKVSVRELRYAVDQANRDYEREGPPAQEKAQAFLADAQAKHPTASITWEGDNRLLVKALGKPPKKKAFGDVWDEKRHAKGCQCEAFKISRHYSYLDDEERERFKLERVCVDAAGWKKFNPSGRAYTAESRPKSKEQREKEMAADAEKAVSADHRYGGYSPKETAVHAKVVNHRDVDRVVLMALADHMQAPSYTYYAWQAVMALSPKEVRDRIRLLAVQKVLRGVYGKDAVKADRGTKAILADLKIDPTALGYVAEPKPGELHLQLDAARLPAAKKKPVTKKKAIAKAAKRKPVKKAAAKKKAKR